MPFDSTLLEPVAEAGFDPALLEPIETPDKPTVPISIRGALPSPITGRIEMLPPSTLAEAEGPIARQGVFEPTIQVPRIPIAKEESVFTALPKAAVNLAVGIPEFLSSPAGVASAIVGGGVGGIAGTAVKAGFAVDTAYNTIRQVPELLDTWNTLTPAQKTEAAVNLAGSGLLATALTRSTISDIRGRLNATKAKAAEAQAIDQARAVGLDRAALEAEMIIPTKERLETLTRPSRVRPAQESPVIIGEQPFVPQPLEIPGAAARQEVIPVSGGTPVDIARETRGKISFGTPAEAGAIPSARQAAVQPEARIEAAFALPELRPSIGPLSPREVPPLKPESGPVVKSPNQLLSEALLRLPNDIRQEIGPLRIRENVEFPAALEGSGALLRGRTILLEAGEPASPDTILHEVLHDYVLKHPELYSPNEMLGMEKAVDALHAKILATERGTPPKPPAGPPAAQPQEPYAKTKVQTTGGIPPERQGITAERGAETQTETGTPLGGRPGGPQQEGQSPVLLIYEAAQTTAETFGEFIRSKGQPAQRTSIQIGEAVRASPDAPALLDLLRAEAERASSQLREGLKRGDPQAPNLASKPQFFREAIEAALDITPERKAQMTEAEYTRRMTGGISEAPGTTPDLVESGPPSPQALGIIPPAQIPQAAGATLADAARSVLAIGRLYSEWLPDRIRRIAGGKPVGNQVANEANQIISDAKQLYGSLAPTLDPARIEAGKLSKATTWLHGVEDAPHGTGVGRLVKALEGPIGNVPAPFRPTVQAIRDANLAIGQLAQQGSPGFVATGKMQRNLTSFGMDLIRRGEGELWNRWTEAIAQMSGKPVAAAQVHFRRWKAELDKPGSDTATIEKINQDFHREFPSVPTHIKVMGEQVPLLHADAFSYLENAAQRTAHAVAFRRVYPPDTGALSATRTVFMKEVPSRYAGDFDVLMRALQGHPADTLPPWIRPESPLSMLASGLNRTIGNVMSRLVLTGNFFVNLPETLVGGTPQFLGVKGYLQSLAKLKQLYPTLEQQGAVNRALYDMSFDPNAPLGSLSRIAGNTISKAFVERAMNEVQEGGAAAHAYLTAERIRAGQLTPFEQRTLPHTLEVMGFTKAQAADIMANRNPKLLEQFQTKAAAFLTAGNTAIAEGSRAGVSRVFNSLFRFQSYPMMKLNQARRVFGHLADVAKREDLHTSAGRAQLAGASEIAARWLFGTTLQGALTAGVTALVFGGPEGLKVKTEEAKDEPGKFLIDSLLASLGGPIYVVARGLESAGLRDVPNMLVNTAFPLSITRELTDMAQGAGSYRDQSAPDRLDRFLFQRLAGGRIIRQVLSAAGLGMRNEKLDADIRGFYRWRREELGYTTEERFLRSDEREQFRTHMRSAVNAMQENRSPVEALKRAAEAPGVKTYGQLAQSLNARQILRTPDGKALNTEQLNGLRSRIGVEGVERLEFWDAKLRLIAEVLSEFSDVPVKPKVSARILPRAAARPTPVLERRTALIQRREQSQLPQTR